MITKEEKDIILQNHEVSRKGVFQILNDRKTFGKWPFLASIIAAICLAFVIFFFPKNSFFILQTFTDIVISVFPSLLGFSLGGYAIIVGFSNTELIKKTAKKDKYSTYQKLSAIFALSVVFQVILTIVAFFIDWIIKIDVVKTFNFHFYMFEHIINVIVLGVMVFGSIYSLLLMPYIVYNLFTLSQLNNMHYTVEKFNEEPPK